MDIGRYVASSVLMDSTFDESENFFVHGKEFWISAMWIHWIGLE